MNKVFKIFIDFDGTITTTDVGDAVFRKFGDPVGVEKIIDDLLNDRISARDSWIRLCASVKSISKKDLDDFIDTIPVDPSFHDFIDFCNNRKLEHYILSDGFDYYINRILSRENIGDVKVYSNKLELNELNQLVPSFPYLDAEFPTSANCKRNHIINHSGDDEFTVFIGDGNSDKYTIPFCDFIFAKDDLLRFCEKERISFFPFKNFTDVRTTLENLIARKRLKKRYQAELRRKEIYEAE